ncbi:hypothetical protein E4U42_001833 [Claviceps africana]|uniref:Uncharacterized protein n=1 Tax=Claviceps africana TaxID=83212 RepID=A0A8K0J8R8_9HYPO|nr:hypothetical protein E4U42_001833 [Claviceps africana]
MGSRQSAVATCSSNLQQQPAAAGSRCEASTSQVSSWHLSAVNPPSIFLPLRMPHGLQAVSISESQVRSIGVSIVLQVSSSKFEALGQIVLHLGFTGRTERKAWATPRSATACASSDQSLFSDTSSSGGGGGGGGGGGLAAPRGSPQ